MNIIDTAESELRKQLKSMTTRSTQNVAIFKTCKKYNLPKNDYYVLSNRLSKVLLPYTVLEQARRDVKDYYKNPADGVDTLFSAIGYGVIHGTRMVPFLRELSIGENIPHDMESLDKCLELSTKITKTIKKLKKEIGLDLTALQMEVVNVFPDCPSKVQNYEEHLLDTCEPLWPLVGESIKVPNPNTGEPIKPDMVRPYIVLQAKLDFKRELTEAERQFIDEHKDMFDIRGNNG